MGGVSACHLAMTGATAALSMTGTTEHLLSAVCSCVHGAHELSAAPSSSKDTGMVARAPGVAIHDCCSVVTRKANSPHLHLVVMACNGMVLVTVATHSPWTHRQENVSAD